MVGPYGYRPEKTNCRDNDHLLENRAGPCRRGGMDAEVPDAPLS